MNYYQARKMIDKDLWHWTCQNDDHVWAAGACRDAACIHKTAEEAEEHEAKRIRTIIRTGERRELDTKRGWDCHTEGCKEKEFHEVMVDGWQVVA